MCPPTEACRTVSLGAAALAALAATAALAVFCFVKVVGLVLLGPPRRQACEQADEPPGPMRFGLVFLAGACVVLGIAPGILFSAARRPRPVGRGRAHARPGSRCPATGGLPTAGIASSSSRSSRSSRSGAGAPSAAPAPSWASGQPSSPRSLWTSAGFTKPLRLVLEPVLRPEREIAVRSRGRRRAGGELQRPGAPTHRRVALPAGRTLALSGAARARRLQSGRLGTYVAYLIALVLVLLASVRIGIVG